MINPTTIQQIDEMLVRLRVIRDAEFPHRTELRSHFNDAADKLDLLLNKLYQENKVVTNFQNPFRTFGFNEGLELAAMCLEKYVVIPRGAIEDIAKEIRALKIEVDCEIKHA